MPVVPCDYEDLVGLIGKRIPKDELVARVPMMGGAFDGEKDGHLLFEFFPNRPDLLSIEGLARACRAFFDVRPGLTNYDVTPSGDEVRVEASVAKIRPALGFAYVRGLRINDRLLAALIDVQERLTTGPGRRRKKVAIGIHDAAPVRAPFTYGTVGRDEIRFEPLQMPGEMTPAEILERHEKGRLYAPLLEGHKKVPIIRDRDGKVLSMPPVINGQLTALSTSTKDVIVDVTGTDERSTHALLNIVVTLLAERGGRIESLDVVRGARRTPTPDLTPQTTKLRFLRVRELLGLEASPAEIATYLGRMGHELVETTSRGGLVRSPAWRVDLLHPDDVVEDVGIGYGFDRFQPRLPQTAQFGGVHARSQSSARARTALLGLGFLEGLTLTITSRRDALESVGDASRRVVQVSNPVTLDHAILRPHLYTGLLGLLRANRHRELPQSLFEVGLTVPLEGVEAVNELRAAAVRTAARATFAECKGIVEAFLRDVGIAAELAPSVVPGFLPGRCAEIRSGGRVRGFFGEVHPQTLAHFELTAPAFAFEVRL